MSGTKFDWKNPEEATDFAEIESGVHQAKITDALLVTSKFKDDRTGEFPEQLELRVELIDYPGVTVRWWANTPPKKVGGGYNKLGSMLKGLGDAGLLHDGEMEYSDLIGLRVVVTLHSTVQTSGDRIGQPVLKVLSVDAPKKPKPAASDGKAAKPKVTAKDVEEAADLEF